MTAAASSIPCTDASVVPRGTGLYLHIPFCLCKCPYCGFYSLAGQGGLHIRYVRALIRQLAELSRRAEIGSENVATLFFGGGTPSILPVPLLTEILYQCSHHFSLADDPEISIEVNPATINAEGLLKLRRAGFNRLSIGAQSLTDRDLQVLGRPHTAADVRTTMAAGKKAGFSNLSLDLMFGLPGQTVAEWREVLLQALELAPDHLSLYELSIEPGTPFSRLLAQGKLTLPREEAILAMLDLTQSEVGRSGFYRYEISNYAISRKECRHNINYWLNGSYIGAGAGAVSCFAGRRLKAVEDVEEYCRKAEAGMEPWIEMEELDQESRFRETVVMGLRMTGGVSFSHLRDRFGIDLPSYYGSTLDRLGADGLLVRENDGVRLSARGLLLANTVMAELV